MYLEERGIVMSNKVDLNAQLFDLIDAAYNANELQNPQLQAALMEAAIMTQKHQDPQAINVIYNALLDLKAEQRISAVKLSELAAFVLDQLGKNRQQIANGFGLAYVFGVLF